MKNNSHSGRSAQRKRISCILAKTLLLGVALSAVLALWTAAAESHAHYTPEYAQVDLLPLLQKQTLTEEEYTVLFRQTGLAKVGVDMLYASGRQDELPYLQQRFFAKAEVECSRDNLLVRSERLVDIASACDFLPAAADGDILVTLSSHVFGWRSGHAAIVVDAENRLTLEAIMPGCDSRICSLDDWREYPGFALLRLKNASKEEREQVAAYAQDYLVELPYRVTSFTGLSLSGGAAAKGEAMSSEGALSISGTQCAHLVWYAYHRFGYDLDSDGGFVVTPDDLYHSDLLELVQIYGLDPNS